mmetsp:Transcript_11801/g.35515  ORF Transcript_11801/g.35515 Transcript_11801/m.35515 type:complete len:254 (-) Transcript_11801:343-1104(-)
MFARRLEAMRERSLQTMRLLDVFPLDVRGSEHSREKPDILVLPLIKWPLVLQCLDLMLPIEVARAARNGEPTAHDLVERQLAVVRTHFPDFKLISAEKIIHILASGADPQWVDAPVPFKLVAEPHLMDPRKCGTVALETVHHRYTRRQHSGACYAFGNNLFVCSGRVALGAGPLESYRPIVMTLCTKAYPARKECQMRLNPCDDGGRQHKLVEFFLDTTIDGVQLVMHAYVAPFLGMCAEWNHDGSDTLLPLT